MEALGCLGDSPHFWVLEFNRICRGPLSTSVVILTGSSRQRGGPSMGAISCHLRVFSVSHSSGGMSPWHLHLHFPVRVFPCAYWPFISFLKSLLGSFVCLKFLKVRALFLLSFWYSLDSVPSCGGLFLKVSFEEQKLAFWWISVSQLFSFV